MKQQDFDFMDEMARKALEDFQVPFNPDDWKVMEEKLNRKEHKTPKLWIFKGIEATVITLALLLLFTVFSVPKQTDYITSAQDGDNNTSAAQTGEHSIAMSGSNNHSESHLQSNQQQFAHLQSALQTQQQSLHGGSTQAGVVQLRKEEPKGAALLGGQSLSAAVNKTQKSSSMGTSGGFNLPFGLSLKGNNTINNNNNNKLSSLGNSNNNHLSSLNGNSLTQQVATAHHNPFISENQNNSNTKTTEDTENQVETNTRQLATSMLPTIGAGNGIGGGDEPLFELKRMKIKETYINRLRLGLQMSADANTDSGYGNSHLGYSAGWTLEAEFSYFFSIQSGLSVSQKNYRNQTEYVATSPADENKQYNVKEESVTRLTLVQIPLQIQGSFFRNKNWRLGISAGAMANFIVGKSFTGTQRLEHNGLTLFNTINPHDYERGWWQGAGLGNNFYCSVGGGFLAERQLTDRWSLLVQPQYYHALAFKPSAAGFKVGTFSMMVGVRGTF